MKELVWCIIVVLRIFWKDSKGIYLNKSKVISYIIRKKSIVDCFVFMVNLEVFLVTFSEVLDQLKGFALLLVQAVVSHYLLVLTAEPPHNILQFQQIKLCSLTLYDESAAMSESFYCLQNQILPEEVTL
jgi:hypothetical protein